MFPVFFLSKLRNHEVSLVSINQQTSYDPGILRQDDRIIKCLPINPQEFKFFNQIVKKALRTIVSIYNILYILNIDAIIRKASFLRFD